MQTVKAYIIGVLASTLSRGGSTSERVTLTLANTDYAATTAPPASVKYLEIYCASAVKYAIGEATSTTVGSIAAAGVVKMEPIVLSTVAADNLPHAQSETAGAVVTFTWRLA